MTSTEEKGTNLQYEEDIFEKIFGWSIIFVIKLSSLYYSKENKFMQKLMRLILQIMIKVFLDYALKQVNFLIV